VSDPVSGVHTVEEPMKSLFLGVGLVTTPETAGAIDADQPRANLPTLNLHALTPRERNRLRLLAQRYRTRRDTTLRPWADVVFDLRLRHGLQLSMGKGAGAGEW
jgi:hypothetical protein